MGIAVACTTVTCHCLTSLTSRGDLAANGVWVPATRGVASAKTDRNMTPCSKSACEAASEPVQLRTALGSRAAAVHAVEGLLRLICTSPTLPVLRSWMGQVSSPVAVEPAVQKGGMFDAVRVYRLCLLCKTKLLVKQAHNTPAFVGLMHSLSRMTTASIGCTRGVSCTCFARGARAPNTEDPSA